ncbi:hypothetical protein BD770DRAFT_447662 [Pilaira anomala]|nr:hypothetical protein BD770DRAFT_447662 [Pilaira anomala]
MASSNPISTTGATLPTVDQSSNGYVSSSLPLPMAYLTLLKLMVTNMDVDSIISDSYVSHNTYIQLNTISYN